MDIREMIFGTVGGLALFLYGMGMLSDGLKMAAGDGLRSLLAKVTRWPIVALFVGAGVTALIQSSSATTVMVVGLINAGLLTLKQAIGVILGANIGTTVTGWLVAWVTALKAFKISTYAMPFIATGFVMHLCARRQKLKSLGGILLGLGLLFLGLHLMKDAFGDLGDKKNSPLIDILGMIGDRPLLAILAGAVFTMIIQSSSASIAMVIVLAANGGFGADDSDALRIAIPFILGDNIGTTITAQIASLRTSISGKRAAMAHTLFNIVGVIIIMPLVYSGIYPHFVESISPAGTTIGIHIAIAHSMFNVTAAFVVLPFVGVLEKIVLKILPVGKEGEIKPVTLEEHLLETPPLAIEQARREIVRMTKTAKSALDDAIVAICENDYSKLKKVADKEDAVDDFQNTITNYLVKLSQRTLAQKQANEFPVLLHIVNDIERVGDHAKNIAESAERKMDKRENFSDGAHREIAQMQSEVDKMFDNVLVSLENSDVEIAKSALEHEKNINKMQKDLRRSHVRRLGEGSCSATTGLIFVDLVDNLEKIGDHLANVAQGVIGDLQWHEKDESQEA